MTHTIMANPPRPRREGAGVRATEVTFPRPAGEDQDERPALAKEFGKFVLTTWMQGLIAYELFAAEVDPHGRVLPTLGL